MIKKRYIILTIPAIVSLLVGSLLYIEVAFAQKEKEPIEVEVVNLTVDEQGNLKVVLNEPLQMHNASVAIPVLEWRSGSDRANRLQGLTFANALKARATIPFVFNPRQTFFRITDFWVSVSVLDQSGYGGYASRIQFEMIFNNVTSYSVFIEGPQAGRMHLLTLHIEEPDVLASLVPSINTITFANPSVCILPFNEWFYDYSISIYMITAYIEYEYQA